MNCLKIEELNKISIDSKLWVASKNRIRDSVWGKAKSEISGKVLWPVEILMTTIMDVNMEHFYENYEQ